MNKDQGSMKYPQLVSMPSAVQDWLDEQLEARGIDAVVYTRYILSLLQRDTLDLSDDLLVLSSNKGKEVGRRGRKRGRNREDYWDVWDCEQLKRSAAVECLMSASDQKCGIEKLVDELCAKLKEIQSEGESSIHLELSHTPLARKEANTPSLQDQVQNYYAAFPPLNSKFAESGDSFINIIPEQSSAWNGKNILANSFGKNKSCNESVQEEKVIGTKGWVEENKENEGKNNSSWKEVGRESMRSRTQLMNNIKGNKELGYGFAWNMESEQNTGLSEFCPSGSSEGSNAELLRVFHYNRQNQVYTADGNSKATDKNIWESSICRRLYERQAEDEKNVFADSIEHPDEDELQISCDDEKSQSSASGEGMDDRNLAQLIAKFDHSIEALWNPDDAPSPPDNFSSDGTVECDQDLPVDFNQLLSSPGEQYLTVELYNLNSKRNPCVLSANNSFIQCGTNITSSIWSDQQSQENSIDQDEFGMEYTQCDMNVGKDPSEEVNSKVSQCLHTDGSRYTVLMVGEEKVVGSKLSLDHMKGPRSEEKECSDSLFINSTAHDIPQHGEEKSNLSWNKYDNFPSFFSSLPWTVNYSIGEITQATETKKWSEVENVGSQGNYSPFGNTFNSCYNNLKNSTSQNFNSCLNIGLSDSLNTLNHNREDSSFTEVIPKQNSHRNILANEPDHSGSKVDLPSNDYNLETKDDGLDKSGLIEPEKEEEDLLTSTKTHFRPIRMENVGIQNSTNSSNNNNNNTNNVGPYADGTTFVIPTSLEEVAFKRSESGALYLEAESEAGVNTPNKYMEYKEKEAYGGRHHIYDECLKNCEETNEFIPKFKVCQNEKCCQTEELEEMQQSDEEIDIKRCKQDIRPLNDPEDFYFPGDDHFAEKIINSLDDGCETLSKSEEITDLTVCSIQKEKLIAGNSSHLHNYSQSENENNAGRPESLDDIPLKQSDVSSCKCPYSQHLQKWKMGWQKTSQAEPSVWESAGNKSETWYNIWKSSPGLPGNYPCQCGVSPSADAPESNILPDKEVRMEGNSMKSLQYSRLREELTMEGEQLMSDLSYMQYLYQGSDWQDDTALRDASESDWSPQHEENGDKKLRCLSPAEDSAQEMMLYAEDAGCTQSLPSPLVSHPSRVKETKSEEDFSTSCLTITLPKTALLSTELEAEWKLNERPFNVKAIQKDRKRRHSSSQRACSYYLEGSCRRPHCRYSHDLATVPCRFWADSSCLKGIACPFLHDGAQALRPVTL